MSDSDYASDQFEDEQESEPEDRPKSLDGAQPRQHRSGLDEEGVQALVEMEAKSRARSQARLANLRSDAKRAPVQMTAGSAEPRRPPPKATSNAPAEASATAAAAAAVSPSTTASSPTAAASPPGTPEREPADPTQRR